MTRLATHAAAAAAGALLALLLTSTATSRQPSASRPAPAAAPQPSAFTPFAGLAQTAAPTLRPAPSHSTWTRPARTEALTAVQPPSAHTPRSPQPAQGQRSGVASWVRASLGAGYLAARLPRGTRLRVCGPLACITRTVNDYGPSVKAFPERIVDLSARDFTRVCGPLSMGVCRVTVQ